MRRRQGLGQPVRFAATSTSLPEPAAERRRADLGRPFHDDEAGSLKVLDKPLSDASNQINDLH
jgi:hypothetical protein